MTSTVTMERNGKTAEVHPSEADNFRAGGWTPVAKVEPKKKAQSKPLPKSPEPDADE